MQFLAAERLPACSMILFRTESTTPFFCPTTDIIPSTSGEGSTLRIGWCLTYYHRCTWPLRGHGSFESVRSKAPIVFGPTTLILIKLLQAGTKPCFRRSSCQFACCPRFYPLPSLNLDTSSYRTYYFVSKYLSQPRRWWLRQLGTVS